MASNRRREARLESTRSWQPLRPAAPSSPAGAERRSGSVRVVRRSKHSGRYCRVETGPMGSCTSRLRVICSGRRVRMVSTASQFRPADLQGIRIRSDRGPSKSRIIMSVVGIVENGERGGDFLHLPAPANLMTAASSSSLCCFNSFTSASARLKSRCAEASSPPRRRWSSGSA